MQRLGNRRDHLIPANAGFHREPNVNRLVNGAGAVVWPPVASSNPPSAIRSNSSSSMTGMPSCWPSRACCPPPRRPKRSWSSSTPSRVTLPPRCLINASASARDRLGRTGQDERHPGERGLLPGGMHRPTGLGAHPDRLQFVEQPWFSGSWKYSWILAATTGPTSGIASSSAEGHRAELLQRLHFLGDDLGHPRTDVADRQPGEQAVERPGLARLESPRPGCRPISSPSARARPGSPRRAVEVGEALDQPLSTSWSISFSPRPSMSMASRWAYQRIHSLSCSGHGWRVRAIVIDLFGLARPAPQFGHSSGRE